MCPGLRARIPTLKPEQRLDLDARFDHEGHVVLVDNQLLGNKAREDGARRSPHLLPDTDCV